MDAPMGSAKMRTGVWSSRRSNRSGGARPSTPRRGQIQRLQVALYAWMLQQERHRPVSAELLWVEIGSARIIREPVHLDFAALERTLRARVDDCIERFEGEYRERASAAKRSRETALPPLLAAPRPGEADPGGGIGPGAARAPAPPGGHRNREDRRHPLPGPAFRSRQRQAALRSHPQEPPAGDGDGDAREPRSRRDRARCSPASEGRHVREPDDDLSRGVLRVRPRFRHARSGKRESFGERCGIGPSSIQRPSSRSPSAERSAPSS